jgi:transposase-like protein
MFFLRHHRKGQVFEVGKKHFMEEQIAYALRQAESGTSVAEVIRKLGIIEQTFCRWKKRFAGPGIAKPCPTRVVELVAGRITRTGPPADVLGL